MEVARVRAPATEPQPRRIAHVSVFPPSGSGVGLYASIFDLVLREFGSVSRVTAPVSPRAAQTLRSAAHGLITGLGPRLRDLDIVHVELSGRALHQFYLAWALTVGPRRALLVLTCHDMPSLVGWPMLFAELERRPARRLAKLMSTTVGRRLERRLLARCDIAIALTEDGADELRRRAGTAAALPHVVDRTEPGAKERRVFVPGYVSEPAVVAAVADVVHREADRTSAEWRLVVGSTDPQTREKRSNGS